MKKFLAMAAAATALAIAAPASAQDWRDRDDRGYRDYRDDRDYRGYRGGSIDRRQNMIEHRIRVGIRNGGLTRSEARQLYLELEATERLEWRFRRNGFTYAERGALHRRLDRLEAHVEAAIHDRERRYG